MSNPAKEILVIGLGLIVVGVVIVNLMNDMDIN